jgi:aryl-alcohol dehydrogenase-like predicted oxidoreductase
LLYKTVSAMPDIRFSAIGFGCWSLGGGSGWRESSDADSIATIHRAIECGITFFDTAPVYGFSGSEALLGEALRGRRDRITLASKCGLLWNDAKIIVRCLAAQAVRNDVENSLRRLRTDHLDILQLHWPDHNTPLEETARVLEEFLRAGKVRYLGVTNFSVADTERLSAMVPISSYQGLYNALERNPAGYHAEVLEYRTEKEILPYCLEKGFAFFPYSPLFQGLLTDDFAYTGGFAPGDVRVHNPQLNGANLVRHLKTRAVLKAVAERAGMSLAHLALSWLTNKPAVTSVICGAQHPDQIAENAAAGDITLSDAIRNDIEKALGEQPLETA